MQNDTTPHLYRAAVITPGISYRGDGTIATIRPGLEVDLLTILNGTRQRFTRQCSIIIAGPTVKAFVEQSEQLRAAGWQHSRIGPWTLFHDDAGREIAVGILASMLVTHIDVLFKRDTDPATIAIILDRYHQITGTAWRGTFATTACAGIRASWESSRYQPLWNEPRKGPGYAIGPLVWTRELGKWERTWGWVHTFDANSAYLGAAITAELPWSQLTHTGPQQFDTALPGYWLLQLDTATLEILADSTRPPVLPSGRVRDSCVWVTTPYARFLRDSLGDRLEVVDSWTATPTLFPGSNRPRPAGARILRPWGEQMRDARAAVEAMPPGPLRQLLLTAVKRTYTDATGAMQRDGMRVQRAIWAHTIIDLWRAQEYRVAIRVYHSAGIWPVGIKTDSLSYADSSDDPGPLQREINGARTAPVGATGLGGWKHQSVVTTEQWITTHPARKMRAGR